MPFRDQEWEDLQRDYDIFPAYTDYMYGPDERLVVTQEPGLHPMIYPIDTSAPIRYTNSMPSRSWSYKTAEGLEKLKNAATKVLSTGHDEVSNSDVSGTNSGSSTPGLDVRSRIGSPLYPLLPPQGVRTVSEKKMARRETFDASQRRPRSRSAFPFTPSQQQQSVRLTRQQTQTRNTPFVHRSGGQPQQPSFLHSSSTTDVDENVAQMASLQKPDMLSPFASPMPMLPPPANLHQQQPQRATGRLPNNLPLSSAPIASPKSSRQISLLQPNDLLHNPRYDCLHSDKRMEIAKILVDRWVVVRESTPNGSLRAKALSDIQNVTMMVNKSIPNIQFGTELQKQRTQQLQTQEALEAQTRLTHQTQPPQNMPQTPQVCVQVQLHPGVSPSQHYQSSQNRPSQPSAPQEPYHSIPYTPQPMEPPQPSTAQSNRAPNNLNSNTTPNSTPPQASAQLRANINRHIPQVWQCLLIARNSSQTAQTKERANQWMGQFKNRLPVEGREYFVQVIQRALFEQSQGRDALAFLGLQNRPA